MLKTDTHKKILAAAAAFLLLFAASLVSQENTGESAREAAESAIVLDDTDDTVLSSEEEPAQPGTVWVLLRIVLVLLLVCAAIYGIVYLLKKSTGVSAASDPYLRIVAQLPLAPGKTAQILSVGSQAFLVGVSDSGIQHIADITDKELIDAMNLEADRNPREPVPAFTALLSRFLPAGMRNRTEGDVSSAHDDVPLSAGETADFIRKQRERLGNNGRNRPDNTGRSK